ncbi:dihydroorotate dehydrogenase B (NAD(+)), catalytic subunit [Planobispora rosea]|uniref:Dihydroorotate dehydrogenase n=1 Tax=Planobispora rosea TaxID=35762 RepID=A0A8J3WCD3_PLARO|nr:dihydroorotate dehydrogenase [Planobispora rosea]GGS54473.1 dihydroorotate dehydrogenase B (NAD(+)), catalytic subunit [Planobispora rosea]GIH82756.1 dihydroorotate dehydrogenase B (NAD(+)), catalytic subunit [Planobispora rosea]
MSVDMRTYLGHVELANPIVTAAGCAGSGAELAQFFDLGRIGALTTRSITMAPRAGRPTPRMTETPSGLLNGVGLQGPGVDAFLTRELPWLAQRNIRTVVSIGGGTVAEYAALARRLNDAPGVTALEVNLSCPNIEDRGRVFARDGAASAEVIAAVRAVMRYDVPVVAKLSPDTADIVSVARACATSGADALSMINNPLGMSIDTETMLPALAAGTGGLSGPAIRPLAVRCVWQVRAALPDVPIIGMGGVLTGRDAFELILAGACVVAVGTALFHDPSSCLRILRELEEIVAARGYQRLADVIGLAHRPPGATARHRTDFEESSL